jgi:hypothetical protein
MRATVRWCNRQSRGPQKLVVVGSTPTLTTERCSRGVTEACQRAKLAVAGSTPAGDTVGRRCSSARWSSSFIRRRSLVRPQPSALGPVPNGSGLQTCGFGTTPALGAGTSGSNPVVLTAASTRTEPERVCDVDGSMPPRQGGRVGSTPTGRTVTAPYFRGLQTPHRGDATVS